MSDERSTSPDNASLDMDDASLDMCLNALACEHRRQLLYELKSREEGYLVLSDDILESHRERNTEKEYVEYYHKHLPKLETVGVVDWDRNTGVVRTGPAFESVSPLLDVVESVESTEE